VVRPRGAVLTGGAGQADPENRLRALRQRLADAGSGDGVDRTAVESALREIDRLGREVAPPRPDEPRQGGAGTAARSGAFDRGVYGIRGTAADNDQSLLELAQERLDLLEAALAVRERAPVRAQEPRQPQRDSAAAARYFRTLGRGAEPDGDTR